MRYGLCFQQLFTTGWYRIRGQISPTPVPLTALDNTIATHLFPPPLGSPALPSSKQLRIPKKIQVPRLDPVPSPSFPCHTKQWTLGNEVFEGVQQGREININIRSDVTSDHMGGQIIFLICFQGLLCLNQNLQNCRIFRMIEKDPFLLKIFDFMNSKIR